MPATKHSPASPVVTKVLRLRRHHAAGCVGAIMSRSEVEKTERNRRSIYAPDTKSLSYIFASTFLSWAVGRTFAPPQIGHAVAPFARLLGCDKPFGDEVGGA